MGEFYTVNGHNLYVEDMGDPDAQVLLYLHGGPGTGVYDFVRYQGEVLSQTMRVIAFDQRGVLRSDPLYDDEPLSMRDLIDDCEALRRELGISHWSVLGHSFGGLVGLLYTSMYPESVASLLFENPTFHLRLSAISLLQAAALEFAAVDRTGEARQCLNAAFSASAPLQTWTAFTEMTNKLGNLRNHLYVHKGEKAFFETLIHESGIPEHNWHRGMIHQRRIYQDEQVFSENMLANVSALHHPTMLMKGRFDHVLCHQQMHAFISAKPDTELVLFNESSHFPHVEEPVRYASVVSNFVHKHA